jgi:hypothetical protein
MGQMEKMMKSINGGPVFPEVRRVRPESGGKARLQRVSGMSLLDYFIAHAPITVSDARKVCLDMAKAGAVTHGEILDMLVNLRIMYGKELINKRTTDTAPTATRDQLVVALKDCVSVMERELNGLAVIQPELRAARAALAAAGAQP